MIRTNDGTSLDDIHEDTGDTLHPLLETIALELTLLRIAVEELCPKD